jgi:hypothetical protein
VIGIGEIFAGGIASTLAGCGERDRVEGLAIRDLHALCADVVAQRFRNEWIPGRDDQGSSFVKADDIAQRIERAVPASE